VSVVKLREKDNIIYAKREKNNEKIIRLLVNEQSSLKLSSTYCCNKGVGVCMGVCLVTLGRDKKNVRKKEKEV
jgi:hypothetical protein